MARTASATQDRRRRVLSEQMKGTDTESIETSNSATGEASSAYSPQSLSDQPRVSDFLPLSLAKIALVLASVGLVAGGIVTLRLYAPEVGPWVAPERLAALTTTAAGSFSAWFASVLFSLATLVCFATYSLRRHRTDDYKGRYRIWRSAGIVCLLAGLSVSTGLHLALGDVLIRLIKIQSPMMQSLAWLLPAALILAPAMVRVVLEMCESRLAMAMLTFAHVGWLAAILLDAGLIQINAPTAIIAMSCVLAGHTLLLGALLLNARHVALQATGELAAPIRIRTKAQTQAKKSKAADKAAARAAAAAAKAAKQEAAKQEAATEKERSRSTSAKQDSGKQAAESIDSAHDEPRGPMISRKTLSSPKAAEPVDERWIDSGADEYDEYGESGRPLSKAERKRLRKQQAREQRETRR